MMPLTSILLCVYGIATGIESGSTADALAVYLDLCGTIISRFNCHPRSPLINGLLSVIIGALIV